MKVILDKEKGLSSYGYKFNLSNYKSSDDDVPIWIQILFSLYCQKNFNFKSMSAEGEADIGEYRSIHRVKRSEASKYFCNDRVLANVFNRQELINWVLIGEYQGVMVKIFGDCNRTTVGLNYPLNSDIDVISMMDNIEKSSLLLKNYVNGVK